MSDDKNENEDQDMKAFEAELAALRPRADRLDDRWRSLLAKEASLTAATLPSTDQPSVGARRGVENTILPSPFGRGAGGEGCVNPTGHRYMCIHCGSAASTRRWAWPTAFSGMTAVAAVLLVMLAVRSTPPIAEQTDKPRSESAPILDHRLAERNAMSFPDVHQSGEMPYLVLRNQVLRDGVESWTLPVSTIATATEPVEGPLSYREQLERLLKEQGYRGS